MTAEKTQTGKDLEAVKRLEQAHHDICTEISKIIIGQTEIINQLLVSLLSRGHCLLVGVPGLAKSLLISTLSSILDLKFNRIQFTPDLMPSDITGTEVIEEDMFTGRFSPILSWLMKLIVHHLKHRLLYYRPCRNMKSRQLEKLINWMNPFLSWQLRIL